MPGVDPAAGTLAVPIWLAGAAVAVFVVDILLAAERAGGVALITSLFRVGLIAAAVLGAWLYVQLGDVAAKDPNRDSERRALDDRKTALMAGSIAPGSALSCLDKLAGEAVESACEKALFASPESVASAVKYVVAQIELLNDGTAYAGRGDAGYAAEFTPLRTAIELDRFGLVAHVLRDREGCTVEHCDALARLRDSTRVLANLRDHTFEEQVKKYTAIWNAPRPPEGVVAAAGPWVALLEAHGPGTLASLPREPAAAESASQSAAVAPPATLGSVTSLQQEQPPLRDSAAVAVSQESSREATSHSAGPLHSGSPEGNAAASPSGLSHETLSTASPDVSERPVASPATRRRSEGVSMERVSSLPHKGGWAWRFHVEGRLCRRACRPFSRGLRDWRPRSGFCRAAVCRWTCDGCRCRWVDDSKRLSRRLPTKPGGGPQGPRK
jgi:hypothetical protein